MGLLSGSMVFLSVIGRYFYSKYGLKYKHKNKIWSVIVMWTASIFIMFVAKLVSSFALVLVACLLIGLGTSIGSLVVIGFIKCFPASVFSGYSAGTGFSGLLGALLYLLLKLYRFSFDSILLVMLCFYPFFGLAFYGIVQIKVQMTARRQEASILSRSHADYETITNPELDLSGLSSESIKETVEEQEAQINEELSAHNVRLITAQISKLLWAFYLLYVFEYISITEIGDQIAIKYTRLQNPGDVVLGRTRHLFFEILQLAYQVGLFGGRSSLDLCKVRSVFAIIACLGIAAGLAFLQIFWSVALQSALVYANFLVIGVFGGLGYANITFWVLENQQLGKKYKVVVTKGAVTGFADAVLGLRDHFE